MISSRKLFLMSLFVLACLFANSVYSDTLRVGISTGYAPVAFKNNGKITGIEADLARSVATTSGMTVQLIETPWDDLEKALNNGDIDVIMAGISITDKRQKRLDFTLPYMTIGQMVLIKADNIMSLASKVSLYSSGKRFGVEKNTTGENFVKSEFPGSKVMSFTTVKQGVKALKDNQIDYFIHDAPTIWQYTVLPKTQDKELFGLYEYMTKEPIAWAVKKGNHDLLKKLNKALSELQSRGVVKKTINHWLPITIEVGN